MITGCCVMVALGAVEFVVGVIVVLAWRRVARMQRESQRTLHLANGTLQRTAIPHRFVSGVDLRPGELALLLEEGEDR